VTSNAANSENLVQEILMVTLRACRAAVMLLSCLTVVRAVADEIKFPVDLQVMIEEATEAYYDGDYVNAMRLSDEARQWAKLAKNKKLMEERRIDWQIIDGRVVALQAEILLAQGNYGAAGAKTSSAKRILEARRPYWTRRRDPIALCWLELADSYLSFVAGDVCRPCPDFQQGDRLTGLVQQFVEVQGQGDKAVRHYKAAIFKLDKLQVSALPDRDVVDGVPMFCNQLRIKAFVSLAKTEIFRSGCPDESRLNDARAFLVRAEELQTHNGWWKVAVGPDAMIRNVGYHTLQKAADEKLRAMGSQGVVKESEIIELKRNFWQAITDWLSIMFVRAEVEAYAELQGLSLTSQTGAWERDAAERCYQRAQLLLSSHFRPGHPMLKTAVRSKAVWLTIASDVAILDRRLTELQAVRFATMSRDAVFLVHKLRAQMADSITASDRSELACLEIRALNNLLKIHEKMPVFSGQQLAEANSRLEILMDELGEIARLSQARRAEGGSGETEGDDESQGS
jgi:hypothetical protein